MHDSKIVKVAQGPAKLATNEDLKKDAHGMTHPNLHTRIEPHDPPPESREVRPADYDLTVQNVNSYRTTHKHYHDEESSESEIP